MLKNERFAMKKRIIFIASILIMLPVNSLGMNDEPATTGRILHDETLLTAQQAEGLDGVAGDIQRAIGHEYRIKNQSALWGGISIFVTGAAYFAYLKKRRKWSSIKSLIAAACGGIVTGVVGMSLFDRFMGRTVRRQFGNTLQTRIGPHLRTCGITRDIWVSQFKDYCHNNLTPRQGHNEKKFLLEAANRVYGRVLPYMREPRETHGENNFFAELSEQLKDMTAMGNADIEILQSKF